MSLARNLKLDNKKRITLGKIADNNVTSYDVEVCSVHYNVRYSKLLKSV